MTEKSKTTLLPHQEGGVATIQGHAGVVLLADDMSLGKTIQALTWADRHLRKWPMVVVCPATLKVNWQREASLHRNLSSVILDGRDPKAHRGRLKGGRLVYVVNYDILKDWLPKLKALKPGLVVLDEAQAIINRKAKRTKAVKELGKITPHRIVATGTPMMSRPSELFAMLNFLWPEEFRSFFAFAKRYCKLTRKPWGWDASGARNLKELHKRLLGLGMIRRRTDVLGKLPDMVREVVQIDLDPKDLFTYREAERDFIAWLRKIDWRYANKAQKAERMVKQGYLKRLVGKMKAEPVRQWVEDFLSGEFDRTDKLVLFGDQRALVKHFHEEFPRSVMVNGTVTGVKRQKAFDSFNLDPGVDLFTGNTRAAGAGWNCVSSSSVAFFELDWNPAMHTQAERRVWGLKRGRKGKRVRIYYLVVRGTIEEKLLKVLQAKQKSADTVVDGRKVEKFSAFDAVAASYLGGE